MGLNELIEQMNYYQNSCDSDIKQDIRLCSAELEKDKIKVYFEEDSKDIPKKIRALGYFIINAFEYAGIDFNLEENPEDLAGARLIEDEKYENPDLLFFGGVSDYYDQNDIDRLVYSIVCNRNDKGDYDNSATISIDVERMIAGYTAEELLSAIGSCIVCFWDGGKNKSAN